MSVIGLERGRVKLTLVASQVNTTVNGTQGTQLRISGANNKCGSGESYISQPSGRLF
mgnify:FL=1